jgi:hypothetical protein
MIRGSIALLGLLCCGGALLYQGYPLTIYLDTPMLISLALTLGVALLWWPRYRRLKQRQRWGEMAWQLQLQAAGVIVLTRLFQMFYQLEQAPDQVKVGPMLGILLLLPLYLGLVRLWVLRPQVPIRNTSALK